MTVQAIEERLVQAKNNALQQLDVPEDLAHQIQLAPPPDPHMGDRGFPCFVLARHLRKGPPAIASQVAEVIRQSLQPDDIIEEVNATGPYVNLRFNRGKLALLVVSQVLTEATKYGANIIEKSEHWMLEYSAPNTNKPQHLGHVRNNLLGQTVATILDFAGHKVTRVNLINDRGIHICKSMLAYKLYGEGKTPQSTGQKGDHLVGSFYVLFEQKFSEEYAQWQHTAQALETFKKWMSSDKAQQARKEITDSEELEKHFFAYYKDTYFNEVSSLGAQAKAMLVNWEAGDEETWTLWRTMNKWVIEGFNDTYQRLGIDFDKTYYESDTYKLGKEAVHKGLEANKFERLDDGAVVCNLDQVGLQGQKVLLRRDGTSVYMTQDLGTALSRFDEYHMDRMVYVVGNEQDYHFDVLFRILSLIEPTLAGRLFHLSYGMVLLPEGKMKSREGKVVDADDLMNEMTTLAEEAIRERYTELSDEQICHRSELIGLAALKYFIMDFNPRSTVQFDPKKSIDFQGRTGPYCLYSYARIQSIGRKIGGWPALTPEQTHDALRALNSELEIALIQQLQAWPRMVSIAARDLDPSKITEHLFFVCKAFSTMYNDDDHRIIDLPEGPRRHGLLLLSQAVGIVLKSGLELLGIKTLEEM